jgi:membrane-associated protein
MDFFSLALDILFHMDQNLLLVIQQYGFLIYPLLFCVVFLETGVVFTPFLPGDSLLFVAGAIASTGALNIYMLFGVLALAAIAGDTANYHIGKYIGKRIIRSKRINKGYIRKAEDFYERHGGKTIILARFVPVVRTFAPFVAGMGKMRYRRFIVFNIAGGVCWTAIFLVAGYLFGNLPVVRDNISLMFIAIVLASFIPFGAEFARRKLKKR